MRRSAIRILFAAETRLTLAKECHPGSGSLCTDEMVCCSHVPDRDRLMHRIAGHSVHRDWNVLHRFLTLLSGDDDLFQKSRRLSRHVRWVQRTSRSWRDVEDERP